MTFEDRAKLIWAALESDLEDRGCFNGIDDDVMEELAASMQRIIIDKLGRQESTP